MFVVGIPTAAVQLGNHDGDDRHNDDIAKRCNIMQWTRECIEGDEVIGYGYTNLSFQESQIAILKSVLTPIEHKELAKTIVKNYLKNNTVSKIKRF